MVNRKIVSTFLTVINIILYLVVIALWVSMPSYLTLNLSVTLIALCVTVSILILNKDRFRDLYTSLFFKKLLSHLLSVVLVLGILGFVNYLSYKNTIFFDVTKNKVNSLTKETGKVVRDLKEPLSFKVFGKNSNAGNIFDLLNLYRYLNSKIDVEFFDLALRPDMVSQYQITKSDTLVIEYDGKKEYLTEITELAITNAIIRLSRNKTPVIYYSSGHGEWGLKSEGHFGLTHLYSMLVSANINVREINLRSLEKVSDQMKTLMIWGPKEVFTISELEKLEDFLNKGGRLIVAIDPNFEHQKLDSLRAFLAKKGIEIKNNLVVDQIHKVAGSKGTAPIVKNFNKQNRFVKGFTEAVFFPLVGQVSLVEAEGIKKERLATTSIFPASWAESNPRELAQEGGVRFHDGKDAPGPINVAASVKSYKNKFEIIAFGNSTFVTNSYSKFTNNFNLLKNVFKNLLNEGEITSFNLPVEKDGPVFISGTQMGIIFYFSVMLAPLLLIGTAVFFYRRRRLL